MQVFVTGSTGLLGSNVVRMLVAAGHQVKALVRSQRKAQQLLGDLKVEWVNGDMEDIKAFAPHLAGCDVVFHTAAYFREYYATGDHWAKLEAINVHGTIQLLDAAAAQGVKKVIYVSSGGVIGKTSDGRPGDESTPPDADLMTNLYFRSKVVAEEKVYAWLQDHSLPVVLILPTAMFGPGDAAPTAAGEMILNFLHGKLPAVPPGGFSAVDVRDVAQGMINAIEKGRSGERYIISNRYYGVGEILGLLHTITGIPKPRLALPYPLALGLAYVSEAGARLTGSKPMIPLNGVKTLNLRREVQTRKAQQELGVTIRPFEETLRDEVQWYLTHGYLHQVPRLALAT